MPRYDLMIVSGGQTGVDRAALDFAIARGYPHGGWCPRGRRAEDGILHDRYQLVETESRNYRQRTRRNVTDSDATLILSIGEPEGGTLTTFRYAQQYNKPVQIVMLDREEGGEVLVRIATWLSHHGIGRLNIAGPRESKQPGIYHQAGAWLRALDRQLASGMPCSV